MIDSTILQAIRAATAYIKDQRRPSSSLSARQALARMMSEANHIPNNPLYIGYSFSENVTKVVIFLRVEGKERDENPIFTMTEAGITATAVNQELVMPNVQKALMAILQGWVRGDWVVDTPFSDTRVAIRNAYDKSIGLYVDDLLPYDEHIPWEIEIGGW